MFREKTWRTFFSTLFLGVYLFVALFSQNYHHHEISVFQKSELGNFDKSLSNSSFDADQSNCLSCHFLFTGNSLIPQEFNFEFQHFEVQQQEIFANAQHHFVSTSYFIFLRGPPLDFI